MPERTASLDRETTETKVRVRLNLDGKGKARVKTGIPFFDHMLTLFARHAVVDLELRCKGDLEVDAHHTVEDCGIALGQVILKALGEKRGLRRYGAGFNPRNPANAGRDADGPSGRRSGRGFDPRKPLTGEAYVPMDECLARCVVDFAGRPFLVWRGLSPLSLRKISAEERGQDMSSSFRFGLAREFFQGFANEARCNLHLELLYGEEPHHVVEALFKAFARAVDAAAQRDPRILDQLPSTKGRLG
jgi:imidazoleglycerol-phosphate dehydratase